MTFYSSPQVEFAGVLGANPSTLRALLLSEKNVPWTEKDREKYGASYAEMTPEQKENNLSWQKSRRDAKAVAEGREPGKVGRPPRLTPEEKEARRIAQNKKRSLRTRARIKKQRAARAIAEGREPGKVGGPRIFTDEQRIENRRASAMKCKWANIDEVRAKNNEFKKAKTAARAVAERRVPGILGHLATFSVEELAAYLERWPRDKDVYHNRIHAQNSRAKRMGAPGTLTAMDVREAYLEQMGYCAFCAKPFGEEIPEIDHWLPLAKGGSNDRENIKLLHKACNRTKGAKLPEELGLSDSAVTTKGD